MIVSPIARQPTTEEDGDSHANISFSCFLLLNSHPVTTLKQRNLRELSLGWVQPEVRNIHYERKKRLQLQVQY